MVIRTHYSITDAGELLYKNSCPDLVLTTTGTTPTHLIELTNGVVLVSAPLLCKSLEEFTNKIKKTGYSGGAVVQDYFHAPCGKTYPVERVVELKHKDRKLIKY